MLLLQYALEHNIVWLLSTLTVLTLRSDLVQHIGDLSIDIKAKFNKSRHTTRYYSGTKKRAYKANVKII